MEGEERFEKAGERCAGAASEAVRDGTAMREGSVKGMPLRFASSAFGRARGLLGRRRFDGVLVIAPCRDIHTVGMSEPIDVAFVDGLGTVLEAHRLVGPFKRLRNRRAACVLERFSRCGGPWFRRGERLLLSGPPSSAGDPSAKMREGESDDEGTDEKGERR